MFRLVAGAIALLICSGSFCAETKPNAKEKALKILEEAEEAYAAVNDYTAVFEKRERIGGELGPVRNFLFKFRKPFSIYMKWLDEGAEKGMELIYVKGKYNDRILIHAVGLADIITPTMEIDIDSDLAMKDNRHPITEHGIGYFLQRFGRDFRKAAAENEIAVIYGGERTVDGRKAHEVEVYFYPHKAGRDYYAYRSVVYFDVENKLPIRMLFYNWRNELLESYAYKNLELNCGLTDIDFDPKNPAYNFGLFPLQPLERTKVSLKGIMPNCDYYKLVVMPYEERIFPLIKAKRRRAYYLGYKFDEDEPRVIATETKTRCWFNSLRFLVGVARRDGSFYITRVVALNPDETLAWERKLVEKNRFPKQFAGKSAKDAFIVGRDVDAITGATFSVKGSTQAIRETVDLLVSAFADKDLMAAAEKASPISLRTEGTTEAMK